MARLPNPIIQNLDAIWPEDWTLREKSFYSIIGQAVRARAASEKNEKEGEVKSKSD